MYRKVLIFLFALLSFLLIVACSDDSEGTEYLFDRETSEMTVLRQCADDADSGAYCFLLRFRVPIETEDLDSFYIWVDTTVIGDTAKSVSDSKLAKATAVFPYNSARSNYDTIDLTPYIQSFVEDGYDSLMVGFFCGYSDNGDPGSVQRVYLHFGDDLKPSNVNFSEDSTWTTGAQFKWYRPSDQTDYYKSNILNGPIAGYNVTIQASDTSEDIRNAKVKVICASGTDSTGSKLYKRHARFMNNNDSIDVKDPVEHGDNRKNVLHILIYDGLGMDTSDNEQNLFQLVIEGLKPEHTYLRGFGAYDSAGNETGDEEPNTKFHTTDSIAPLIAKKIFTLKDSLYPELTRLDSNNRVRIFWDRSVDPLVKTHHIVEDSVLIYPSSCYNPECFDLTDTILYYIDYYDTASKNWVSYTYAGGVNRTRYTKLYGFDGDTIVVDPDGSLITDTIRWVAPGDTLIIRIRARDASGYYSKALVDTLAISPGALANQVDCPEGFIAVETDSSVFCMEKFEHRDTSGNFMTNVLHSEAMAACEAISASGFTVSLCGERDWQEVCLSGGTYSYGVVEDDTLDAEEYLYTYCNVRSGDSATAMDIGLRNPRCVSPMGVRDFPGQLQEWVIGRSEDTLAVIRGGSYVIYGGLDRESQALCTTRSFPYFTRPAYTTDTLYLYREGTKVDTLFEQDTSLTAYETKPILTQKDFTDSLQFFDVQDSNGNSIGTDYALYSEYKKGGDAWLDSLAGNLKYVPDHVEVVFLTGETVAYRKAAAFYKSNSIGFRCCAYPE